MGQCAAEYIQYPSEARRTAQLSPPSQDVTKNPHSSTPTSHDLRGIVERYRSEAQPQLLTPNKFALVLTNCSSQPTHTQEIEVKWIQGHFYDETLPHTLLSHSLW